MDWFKNAFKSQEQRDAEAAELERRVRDTIALENEIAAVAAQEAAQARLEEEARIRVEVEAKILSEKLASSTPWFEPIPDTDDKVYITERYLWNQAFIKDLIKKGHKGESDSELIQSYLDKEEEDARKAIVAAEREKLRNSSEPWVEVIGQTAEGDHRMGLQLDWNDAFIKYLRQNGFRGANDDVLVHQWVAALQQDLEGSTGEYM